MRRTGPDVSSQPWAAPRQPTFRSDIRGPLRHVSHSGGTAVSIAEAKHHVYAVTDADDHLLLRLLKSAERWCETGGRNTTQRVQIMPATFDLPVRTWWQMLDLKPFPLQAVSSIKYFDINNTETTLATTYYNVFAKDLRQPGTIELAPGQDWPSLEDERTYPITVRFVAGYLAPVTAVAATDVLTSTGRSFNDNDLVRFWNPGGASAALPAGLRSDQDYWIRDASGSTFKVTDVPSGTAIDITGTGTGLHYAGLIPHEITQAILMLCSYWYAHREAGMGTHVPQKVAFGVEELLESALGGGAYS